VATALHNNIRKASLEFASSIRWECPFAVTLTFKTAYYADRIRVPLTGIDASQNLRHFLNLLNRAIYKKGERRKGAAISCVAVREDNGVRPHLHLCLDKPARLSNEQFCAFVTICWPRTRFGYAEVDIKPCTDLHGWLGYMTKYRTKSDYSDAIDWMNVHSGCRV
jgi:hypothetical protein